MIEMKNQVIVCENLKLKIGDKESSDNLISYRKYGSTDTTTVSKDEFKNYILNIIKDKKQTTSISFSLHLKCKEMLKRHNLTCTERYKLIYLNYDKAVQERLYYEKDI